MTSAPAELPLRECMQLDQILWAGVKQNKETNTHLQRVLKKVWQQEVYPNICCERRKKKTLKVYLTHLPPNLNPAHPKQKPTLAIHSSQLSKQQ